MPSAAKIGDKKGATVGEKLNRRFKVKFDLATNFDKGLIEEISAYGDFEWVFGKLNNDVVGGGRPSIRMPKISWTQLEEFVEFCHQHNVKFNYLLNALCLSGKEFQKDFHEDVIDLLRRLDAIGVDGVTVASPYLCQIINEQFPRFFVSISLYNKIENLSQLKQWKDIGADEVTLFHAVNRNFPRLKLLLAYAKQLNLQLRLIANNSCVHECAFHSNHACTHAHGSKSGEKTRLFHFDFQVLNCNLLKIKEPAHIISAEWIRPEDLHIYEELCDELDCDNLTIKLTERGRTREWISRVARAYHTRSYDGNLVDILNYVGKGNFYSELHYEPVKRKIAKDNYNAEMIDNYRASIFYKLPYLDNAKLDNFLKFFVNDYQCDRKICDFNAEPALDGLNPDQTCSYCSVWANKAIMFDQEERERAIALAEQALSDVRTSRIFYGQKEQG